MYFIEYYKTRTIKPILELPVYFEGSKVNAMIKKIIFQKKDLIDMCWNIKSLTIDLDDIEHIICDKKNKYLYGLYARVKRENLGKDVNSITILNDNDVNLSYIYEIINCKWMVNGDEELDNCYLLNVLRNLKSYIDEYDLTDNQNRKKEIENLICYYIKTLNNKKGCSQRENVKSLKLGTHFIRK